MSHSSQNHRVGGFERRGNDRSVAGPVGIEFGGKDRELLRCLCKGAMLPGCWDWSEFQISVASAPYR
jgi:hypothetical protein